MVRNTMHHKRQPKVNTKMKNLPTENSTVQMERDNSTQNQHIDLNQQQEQRRAFFQLAGHKECFKIGTRPDTILKKSTGNEEICLRELGGDELSSFVPKLLDTIMIDGQKYLEMEDLLSKFENASVMDIKIGFRTYREDELDLAAKEDRLRSDMYDKMIEVDRDEPTDEEKKLGAITKPRYMVWRETISSTSSLGFRIEGIRFKDGSIDKEFKTMKDERQIEEAISRYVDSNKIRLKYLKRLHDLKKALLESKFFSSHELIGSSLLFVHNDIDANIWLIDFAKTDTLPENIKVTHRQKWKLGNHEDGYLVGVDNLIRIFEQIISRTRSSDQPTANALDTNSIRSNHSLEPQSISRFTCLYGR